jgi:CDP-glycerol glycerophosphotransferase (TagB/SpsB family)
MAIKQIGSPDPKYLAATDILIGDMSDINYEFLIYDRPIILLANQWLRENFPDIGIKTDLKSLKEAIKDSIEEPEKYTDQRKHWLSKTMYKPDGKSTIRVIDAIIKKSGIDNPFFLLLHGDNAVLRTHLDPLYKVIKLRGYDVDYINFFQEDLYKERDNLICISANNWILDNIRCGFKVHIDHGLKGKGVTDFQEQCLQYQKNNYFKNVNLHITEGEISYTKTKTLLGPYKDRAIMIGYPKADTLLKLNIKENKLSVCRELGFDPKRLIITYAPAGKYSYPFKQGASLSNRTLKLIYKIAKNSEYNFLIKLKVPEKSFLAKIIEKFKKIF